MTKHQTTSATSIERESPDSAEPQKPGDLDLSSVIVQVNLDALIADLEKPAQEGLPHPPPPVAPDPDVVVPSPERRRAARLATSELSDDLQVSIPRAARTTVVNVSRTGVLIETTSQLAPGSTTDLFVKVGGKRQALRATVVRSSLHVLTPALMYRSALHFEKILELPVPQGT